MHTLSHASPQPTCIRRDTDNSGAVSKQEFVSGIRRAGFDAKKADLDAIFDDMDTDGSGELEYIELQHKLQVYSATVEGEHQRSAISAGFFDL